ncbi:MAG: DMT family transporter, partial [Pseudomonadota bacterium]
FTLTPVMSGVAGYILLRQITTWRMALALAIGAAGAIWVIFRADWNALAAFDLGRGEMIYFVGCVAHAIYTPLIRKLNRGEPAVVFTFGTLLAGFALLTIYGWKDIRATHWGSLRPLVWSTILYVAVFATAASFVLTQFAALRLPSAKVMAYTYLTPSWVILWEITMGNGAPGGIVLLGVGLTIVALLMLLKPET